MLLLKEDLYREIYDLADLIDHSFFKENGCRMVETRKLTSFKVRGQNLDYRRTAEIVPGAE